MPAVLQRSWQKRASALRARKQAQHIAATKLQARRRGSIGRARAAKKQQWRSGWLELTTDAGVVHPEPRDVPPRHPKRGRQEQGRGDQDPNLGPAAPRAKGLGQTKVGGQQAAVVRGDSNTVRVLKAKKRQSKAKAAHQAAFFGAGAAVPAHGRGG